MTRPTAKAAPIVMVHGAFCGGWAFDAFRAPFASAGHAVFAPDLPGHQDGSPPAAVCGLSLRDYADAIVEFCAGLAAPPILVGHSLGGLVVQLAAARIPTKGLILLAPSAPWGVAAASPEEILAAMSLHVLGPFWSLAIEPDRYSARRYLFDRLDEPARTAAFARLTAESGRALFETLNWWLDPFAATLVPAGAIAAPTLAIAGGRDALTPAATVDAVVRRLGGEMRIMPSMGHWLIGEPGWEEVAAICLAWLAQVRSGERARRGLIPA